MEWSTIRMLFTLSHVSSWATASIDFKNAFAQAVLPKPIYLEPPPGYLQANPEHRDYVMKINKSLYGDRRAANLWYRKVHGTLTQTLGFYPSELDPCLFIRDDCIIVLYVDDAIIFGQKNQDIRKFLEQLKEQDYDFSEDGTFSSYLGIQLEHKANGAIKMTQPGLKKSIIDVLGLQDSTPAKTPITAPLFKHEDSPPFDESFNYRSVLGMLQYVGNNTHPECAYAINACARYCIQPRQAHGNALKRIGRYLLGVQDEGLYFNSDGDLKLDCYVDADFAGNYNAAESDDGTTLRSRTGFVIMFGNIPVLWKSKVQTKIALSTMESEYIALSTAMRSLIHLRALLFEIKNHFKLSIEERVSTISTVFEDNRACRILATTDPPRLTPQSKSLAIKYHWFRSHLDPESIIIKDIPTDEQKGDGFTKPLTHARFLLFRKIICGW